MQHQKLPSSSSHYRKSPIEEDELRKWEGAGGGDSFRAKAGTLTVDGAGQIVHVGDTKPLDLRDFELQTEVKFTFGTNHAGRTLSRLEYCLQMIAECARTSDDL